MFTVTLWNRRSETSYTFGPFGTDKTLNAFLGRVGEGSLQNYDNPQVTLVNSPSLAGTGSEEALSA